MSTSTVRIELQGRIGPHTARALGGWVEESGAAAVLVAPVADQAQLTGLIVQLADLHIGFDTVTVVPTGTPPASHDPGGELR